MNECYYYLLLLSLFSSLEQTISINLPNVTIQHVCEHEILFIKCLNVNETIQIVRSMYGRTSQRICNQDLTNQVFYKTCANIEQSKNQTKHRCQGKSTCQILIDNTIYTDPCGSTIPKHFEIHYRCLDLEKTCFELFENCSKTKDFKCIEKIQEDYSCQCPSSICEYNLDNQLIGFVENTCPEEIVQGIHWQKTLVNKGQNISCPYPCTGQIFRFCQMNNHWSNANFNDCQCPIQRLDQLSMHHVAHSYVFQCNFWLINRLLPKDNQCIFETDDHSITSCLSNAFEKMSMASCLTFSIDFQNVGFEVFIPMNNQRKFRLPTARFGSNEIIIDKTKNSYGNLPMMMIDPKVSNSLILIEQSNYFNSVQTANVTVIFNQRSSELRYQCRAYRSANSSFQLDSSDMFFVCQLLCSNGSHVICQCPFYNPFMHYVLHLDTSIAKEDFQLNMMENDLKDKCAMEYSNQSIEYSFEKIDSYLRNFSSFNQKKNLAKKLLSFIDTLIGNEELKWNQIVHVIKQMEFIALELIPMPNSFRLIRNHLEFFVNSQDFEDNDRSVIISTNEDINSTYFILSNLNLNQSMNNLNSHILHLNTPQKNLQITFRHLITLNTSTQISTCVSMKNVWSTDGCYLVASNSTHSICSCEHVSTLAVLSNYQTLTMKIHAKLLSKIGFSISTICLILMIITLSIRHRMDTDDDLSIVRNILHINMSICLLISQVLFFFSIDQMKYQFTCRIIAVALPYFLLATLSWIFVDGIELIIALKHRFKLDRIRIIAYSLYSYGFPLLITILSISLSTQRYPSNKHCWYSYDNPFIWTFSIPFVLLILANIFFFILSIYTLIKHRKSSEPCQRIRSSLRDISTISIVFGLTWLICLFYLHKQNSLIIFYGFTILNIFQGVFIFIYYCLLEKQIQHLYFNKILNKSEKSNQHYNTSSSGYSSAQSSEINKLDHQSSFRTNPEYLTNMPTGLLSTFRYPPSTIPMKIEQNEQLLKKYKIDLHDDHQYYEIG